MPHWNHVLKLADVWNRDDLPFEEQRDEIVRRIRTAYFYDPADIVLRGLVDDVADATSTQDFDRHFGYLYMWGDQDHTRVWFETTD